MKCATATKGTARGPLLGLSALTITVKPHDRAEGTPLEPLHKQFPKLLVIMVISVGATDVSCPPGDATHAHIQTCSQLVSETRP
jgi:hypothetical protein